MSAPLQSVSIVRTEQRSSPSPHTVYAILIALPVRNWTVFRRYSEFLALHEELSRAGTGPPPFAFPPKHAIRRSLLVRSFRGDDEEAVRERREMLERYLRGIVSSPDATWREMDCFKEFIELPKSQSVGGSGSGGRVGQQPPKSRAGYVPGSYHTAAGDHHSDSRLPATTRQLGAPSSRPAEETSETRTMTSQDLFDSQQSQFDKQDSQLNDLTAILRRQRQMGMAINQELLEQNELLDAFDGEVQETQGRLGKNDGLIRRLG